MKLIFHLLKMLFIVFIFYMIFGLITSCSNMVDKLKNPETQVGAGTLDDPYRNPVDSWDLKRETLKIKPQPVNLKREDFASLKVGDTLRSVEERFGPNYVALKENSLYYSSNITITMKYYLEPENKILIIYAEGITENTYPMYKVNKFFFQ